MKKFLIFFSALSLIAGLFSAKPVLAQDTGWLIENFTSAVEIKKDTTIQVTETIKVDFKDLQKHGIYRTIPIKYQTRLGNKLNIRLKVLKITDQNQTPLQYQITNEGQNLKIKIGDPNQTISGRQTYVLAYEIRQVINQFSTHDEFYYNVTGDQWPVPILSSQTVVVSAAKPIQKTCFAGPYGSQTPCLITQDSAGQLTFKSPKSLNPSEGLTIVVGLEKGVLAFPSAFQKILMFFQDNFLYFVPFLVFFLLLRHWYKAGRDLQYKTDPIFYKGKEEEILPLFTHEYLPTVHAKIQGLSPAEVGTIIDEKVDQKDLSSIIVDLAVKGFLKIKEIPKKGLLSAKDYLIIKTKEPNQSLKKYESQLLEEIFEKNATEVKLSSLKGTFSPKLANIKSLLYQGLVDQGLFVRRPDKVRLFYLVLGGLICFLGFIFGPIIGILAGSPFSALFAFITSGLLVIIFANFMPKKTAWGRSLYRQAQGLKFFITLGAYREQILERANIFQELLPYAMIFDATKKWVQAFEKLGQKPPEWYEGQNLTSLSVFATSLNSFSSTASSSLTYTPSSASHGGSGFSGGGSGGGFGGGGGGSW